MPRLIQGRSSSRDASSQASAVVVDRERHDLEALAAGSGRRPAFMCGISTRHGPHQEAQNSSSTRAALGADVGQTHGLAFEGVGGELADVLRRWRTACVPRRRLAAPPGSRTLASSSTTHGSSGVSLGQARVSASSTQRSHQPGGIDGQPPHHRIRSASSQCARAPFGF